MPEPDALEFNVTARPADVPGIADRGDSREPGVPSRGVRARGVVSRGVPRGESRGEARGDARGECRGDMRGELARSGCRIIDDADPHGFIVSAGL